MFIKVEKKEGFIMKWDLVSVEKYISAKGYIDTAIVPLIAIELGANMKESVLEAEALIGVVEYIEEQLMGRVLLFPPFSYIKQGEVQMLSAINQFTEYLESNGFKSAVWVTYDISMKRVFEESKGKMVYIDQKPSVDTQNKAQYRKIGERMLPSFIKFWEKG
jgi:hypothetical protein